jgi:hypothetical protein
VPGSPPEQRTRPNQNSTGAHHFDDSISSSYLSSCLALLVRGIRVAGFGFVRCVIFSGHGFQRHFVSPHNYDEQTLRLRTSGSGFH